MISTSFAADLPAPDFLQPAVLLRHIAHSMGFYHPRALDAAGGFYHFLRDDGSIYNAHTRHLVSSTRLVFIYARAWRQFKRAEYRSGLLHALDFLRNVHRQPASDPADTRYLWEFDFINGKVSDPDPLQYCYGHVFVLLAYAEALAAGVSEAGGWLQECMATLDRHFWQEEYGLYADQADSQWRVLPYRGQNANMHACEALLAAHSATGNQHFLQRAIGIADTVCNQLAGQANGLIWEHYDQEWRLDLNYNRHDPQHLFRPWGFQPGHFTEWAKLLLQLEAAAGPSMPAHTLAWLAPRAQALFDAALRYAWDTEHGGLCYGFAPDLQICDSDKYFWVQAETLAAAAMLAARTGQLAYLDCYQQLWEYCWRHFVDHRHGAWYRILRRDNSRISDEKSPAGKVDYHTMGACYTILENLPVLKRLSHLRAA
ncbi:AGE family epimerase/isomerase [Massilia sp. W12]|uniref:AGE family epimerase/isomerase n=1 Tax=Massilia sp. W12 TaxID=3126507 RepID=UPI0030CA6BAD